MKIKRKKGYLLAVFLFFLILFLLDFFGVIWHNAPFAWFYSVKGLDVSHHQKEIDWQKVAKTQKYSFVYIKATEGHDFTDDDFLKNWNGAKQQGLLVGAYHFFSIRSSGAEQADLFTSIVPRDDSALPPVIDIEINLSQDKQKIQTEIKALAEKLEQFYGKKPILYITYDIYDAYIGNDFDDYKIWIRDVFTFPRLQDKEWLFWQYNNRGRVNGIQTYVDINVFRGTMDELKNLAK